MRDWLARSIWNGEMEIVFCGSDKFINYGEKGGRGNGEVDR